MHTHLFHHVCFRLRLHTHTLRSFNECKRNYLNKLCTSFTWSFRFISLHMRLNERRQWNNLIKKLWAYHSLKLNFIWLEMKAKKIERMKQIETKSVQRFCFGNFIMEIYSVDIRSLFSSFLPFNIHAQKKLWNLFRRQCTHSMAWSKLIWTKISRIFLGLKR